MIRTAGIIIWVLVIIMNTVMAADTGMTGANVFFILLGTFFLALQALIPHSK